MEYKSKFIHIKNIDEYAKIASNTAQLNLLIFYADWSGSSHIFLEALKEQQEQLFKKLNNIIIADFDKDKNLNQKFNIDSVPTSLLISNDNVFHQFKGLFSLDEIVKKINEVRIKLVTM